MNFIKCIQCLKLIMAIAIRMWAKLATSSTFQMTTKKFRMKVSISLLLTTPPNFQLPTFDFIFFYISFFPNTAPTKHGINTNITHEGELLLYA